MAIWFTSDTHFGHDSIRRLVGRPFATVEEMDATIIARWNAVVAPDDTVWHLGDFCYRNAAAPEHYVRRLNGRIHLVAGNHDRVTVRDWSHLFESVQQLAVLEAGGKSIVLCHYPLREWDKAYRGAWHLFGHVHGTLDAAPHGFSLDCGVDSHAYRPISIEDIRVLMAGRENPFRMSEDRGAMHRRLRQAKETA
jgi:calcineurin-like phosphoesterase family protein